MAVGPLSAGSLKRECDPDWLKFQNTSQLAPSRELIGQNRASDATDFGLAVQMDGYNLYLSGEPGVGKTRYGLESAQKHGRLMPVPDDWCYVYNFEDSNRPKALNLPAGTGREFKKDMEDFVRTIEQEICKAFEGEEYVTERSRIIKEFREKKDEYSLVLTKEAAERGFRVKMTTSGIYFMPVIDDEPLSEEEFKALDEDVKMELTKSSEILQNETAETIRKIHEIEMEAEKAVRDWENQIALYAVGVHMNILKDKYKLFPFVAEYLNGVQKDILANIDKLVARDDEDQSQSPFYRLMLKRSGEQNPYDHYRINLLVDNSRLTGAPVIVDYNPTYYNLMGRCEYENELGTMITDYTLIKPGLFHQANGGFLILQVTDVMANPRAYEIIKRTLKTRQIVIENIKEQMGLVAVSALKPEPVPVNVKIILVGSPEVYHLLYHMDQDFRKLFKIKADFDDYLPYNQENVHKIAQYISSFCNREGVAHFDKSGVMSVINYSCRLVEDKNKLSAQFSEVGSLLGESGTWARMEGSALVTERHVKKAAAEKRRRSSRYNDELLEQVREGTLLIDTDGYEVGQINGLAVIETGDLAFGKPCRITATTYMGKEGILDIEREVETGGITHSKGVLILSGYIGRKYAQENPLSLSASLCFEQSYGFIDGDSASSAELYAILSSLSDLPVYQGIAATGSVNQLGYIQPIGGVTCKIEGFFEICRIRGLTGKQGIILPSQNIQNLVLNDEVVEAVEKGLFHIYPIKTVEEGLEILTGVRAGDRLPDGSYPNGTINDRISKKLRKFSASFGSLLKSE